MKIRAGSSQCCGLARVEGVGILHRKRFKIKVLENGISEAKSVCNNVYEAPLARRSAQGICQVYLRLSQYLCLR